MRIRIEDVARAAGVSPATVSRVMNEENNVSESTRQRVLDAMKALDYRPLASARSLAGNRTFLIALLYDNNDNPSSTYLAEIQDGVLEACDAQRYSMMVRPLRMRDADLVRRLDSLVSDHHPDGLILTPPLTDFAPLVAFLHERALPFASVSPQHGEGVIGVAMNEQQAARAMVEHLLSLGHRRIAHVTGLPSHGASRWREAGYREAMAAAGLTVDPALVVQGGFTFTTGFEAGRQLLRLDPRPTAVFAANDDMAAGLIWSAGEVGLRVPQDLSVAGFDDVPLARQLWPPLTTVRQPSREMGKIAAAQLLESLRGRGTGELVQVPFSLELRQSTMPPG
ncbi:LacI family DNA-binding transcriptional regulator [Dyella sp.]|uniref:LacI family DNA-binding transcriptional regulator n=1 Tax=Dyella sp. TaxID=1869338 RepID=UPI002D7830A8|nr:LacI family DNA-binding transcriptional regulator [Dyella sp.]HET6433590.1 LacI family DNA-binding transcriptional regulator [Dyella sp.]